MSLDHDATNRRRPMTSLLGRLFARRDGATAIEFAILAIPFFIIVFASIETFVAFTGEQLLASANETMARKIRTGEYRSTMTMQEYRTAFCEEIKVMMPCSASEVTTPAKLFLDVRSFDKFSEIPTTVPLKGTDFDPTGFKFAPGGKQTINIVRAFYRWDVITDLVRPLIYNVSAADGTKNYLMVATSVVQNEDFP